MNVVEARPRARERRMVGEERRTRVVQLLVGTLLIVAFFSLDRTSNTIQVRFVPPWDASSVGELYFWLAAMMFLLPGSALIGSGLSGVLGPLLQSLRERLAEADLRERRVMLLTAFVLAWAIARLGNQVLLHGQPFTDDEDAARFGGQVLAGGSLWAPLPPMRFAFPDLFLFQRAGQWTSFDFLGAVCAWGLAEWTHSETLLFSLAAALLVPSVMCAVMRREGTALGVAAGLLALCSPMALTLSMTSHAHLISRGFFALGLGLILFVEEASFARSLLSGLALGAAFATRPPEMVVLLAPLAIAVVVQAVREPSQRARLWGLALGMLPGMVASFAYNFALSGAFGFLRSAANEISVPYGVAMRGPFAFARWDNRFGNNLSYNALTLSIWFLGPVGLPLAWLGARTSRTHRLLGVGVLMALALCLLHDDRGLHMVGPIHLSDAVVPLAILAFAGLRRVIAALEKLGVAPMQSWAAWLGYALLGLTIFSLWHAQALEQQALARAGLLARAENVAHKPAIVLASEFGGMRSRHSPYGETGGFVFEWRRARPDLSEPVLIVHDSPEARAEVARAFPDRTAYVLDPDNLGPAPVPLANLSAVSAPASAP